MAALWELLPFPKKTKPMYKEKVDYVYVDFKDSDITGIGLNLKGYEGVLYHYNKIRVREDESGIPKLEFGYTLVHPGKHDIDDLNSSYEFHTIMGDILTEILITQQNEPTRTDNPEEFNLQ